MNLIPNETKKTGNYYCTWDTQAIVSQSNEYKKIRTEDGRNVMSEEFLFGSPGILKLIPKEIRGDLLIMIDDGWDVPYNCNPAVDGDKFGSLILNEERFPSFVGLPQERLKKLNDVIKELGYQGLGLWIALQRAELEDLEAEEASEYWIERLKWCDYAGISYWKVDWGKRCHDLFYREMISDNAKIYAPDLKIEHAFVQDPLDMRYKQHLEPEYLKRQYRIGELLEISDYFRIYDCAWAFYFTTTMSRTAEAFLSAKLFGGKQHCIINVEDGVYVGAALGCSIGAMRLPQLEKWKKEEYNALYPFARGYNELKRALRWQRIAPPFEIFETSFDVDENYYTDCYQFPDGEGWPYTWKQVWHMDSYAAISRNMPLAKVESRDEKPYVVCSIHPKTNALGVFVSPRVVGGSVCYTFLADVSVEAKSVDAPIGIFGHYKSLGINFPKSIEDKKIYAQDLASDECVEITNRVQKIGNVLKLSGEIIDEIGLSVKEYDTELPGLIICLK